MNGSWHNHIRQGTVAVCYFLIFSLSHPVTSHSQENFRDIFGSDYDYALKTVEKNRWWSDTIARHGLDPGFALSIVFPELIRYSSILDYIEIKALEVLYVQYGEDYADFSVGYFQMKPSFAEKIEKDIMKYGLEVDYPFLRALKISLTDNTDERRDRVIRLESEQYQLLYLEAFLLVMDRMFPDEQRDSIPLKLAFYSTAYNTGYYKPESVIQKEMGKKRFYRGMDPASVKYSYSDISLEYYLSMFN